MVIVGVEECAYGQGVVESTKIDAIVISNNTKSLLGRRTDRASQRECMKKEEIPKWAPKRMTDRHVPRVGTNFSQPRHHDGCTSLTSLCP